MKILILIFGCLLPCLCYGGIKEKCLAALDELVDPYMQVLTVPEADRPQLTSRVLRYFEPLRLLNDTLQSSNPIPDFDEIIEKGKKIDIRGQSFQLDGSFRASMNASIFKKSKFQKLLKNALDAVSELRFKSGVFSDSQNIALDIKLTREYQRKKGRVVRLSKAFSDEAKKQVQSGKDNFIKFLVKKEWVGKNPKALKLTQDAATALNSLTEREDLEIIEKTLVNYVEGTKATDFDMDDLEGGIHPLRRHLRWIAIMMQGLNMFEVYDPENPPEGSGNAFLPDPQDHFPKVTLDADAKKYAEIIRTGINGRMVYVSKNVFEYLTLMVSELGKCKEVGQRIDRYANIFWESEEAKTKDEAMAKAEKLASLHPVYFNFKARADKLYKELKESGLFDELVLEVINGIHARLAEIP
jgi:hypothetical protein